MFLKILESFTNSKNLVQPDCLSNYKVPPVSTLDPTSNTQDNWELDDVSPQIFGDEPIKMIENDGLEEEMSVEVDDDGSTVGLLQTF